MFRDDGSGYMALMNGWEDGWLETWGKEMIYAKACCQRSWDDRAEAT